MDEDPSEEELFAYELSQVLNQAAAEFDVLCRGRHGERQEEYGELAFLKEDVVGAMLNALADTANMCKQQAVKLIMLQSRLVDQKPTQVQLGAQGFKGTKDGWKS